MIENNVVKLPISTIIPREFDNTWSIDPTIKLDFLDVYKTATILPEMGLWIEVLKLAIEDYQKLFKNKKTIEFQEVYNWFFNNGDKMYLGSFNNVCDMLSINNKKLLKFLINWTRENSCHE